MIASGLETMEIAKEIETSDSLRGWSWYAGALQQHHYATFMVTYYYVNRAATSAIRAWQSLDWIFEVPPNIPHHLKAHWVLTGALEVMRKYAKARTLRCPILMDERLDTESSDPRTPELPKLADSAAVHRSGFDNVEDVSTPSSDNLRFWSSDSTPSDFTPPGFTPINQDDFTLTPLQECDRQLHLINAQFDAASNHSAQRDKFRNVGPSYFKGTKRPRKK